MAKFELDLAEVLSPGDFHYNDSGSQYATNKKYRRALTGWIDAYPKIREYIENLPLGETVHSHVLEQRFNTSGASVRKCTTEMLYKGILVCSNEEGYYRPKDREQALECVKHLESRRDALDAKVKELYMHINREFPAPDGENEVPVGSIADRTHEIETLVLQQRIDKFIDFLKTARDEAKKNNIIFGPYTLDELWKRSKSIFEGNLDEPVVLDRRTYRLRKNIR